MVPLIRLLFVLFLSVCEQLFALCILIWNLISIKIYLNRKLKRKTYIATFRSKVEQNLSSCFVVIWNANLKQESCVAFRNCLNEFALLYEFLTFPVMMGNLNCWLRFVLLLLLLLFFFFSFSFNNFSLLISVFLFVRIAT